MDLYSIKTIKSLLKEQGETPKDRLGQNFLIEKRVALKMLKAADLKPSDTVLEVGAGMGTLTLELAKAAKEVIAVEKDHVMIEILKETLKDFDNVQIIQGDILSQDKELLNLTGGYKMVANLPYYITSPVIRMSLEAQKRPELMVFMVQKEVAQRIAAKPPEMSILAVSAQFYAETKIVSAVRKSAFWPRPKVDSAIIKLVPNKESPSAEEAKSFFRVVKAGFAQPRKQLLNNLSNQLKFSREVVEAWLNHAGIHSTQRAETLSLQDWATLVNSFPKT